MENLEQLPTEENMLIVKAYLIYIPIVIALTIFVARNLFKSGKTFMMDIFNGRQEIALATNRLFEVGFYLFNIGWALLILKISKDVLTTQHTLEALSFKIGGFAIFLGVMLFLNLLLFFRGKRISKRRREEIKPTLDLGTSTTFEGKA